jgi:hypothetical protein
MNAYPWLRLAHLALCAALTLNACGGGGSTDPAPTTPITPNTPVGIDPVADSIVLFTTDSRLKLGPLGNLVFEAYPVALFKDGRALSDTTGLIYPGGLEAHRAKFPNTWTQWRQSGADVQVLQSNGNWNTITPVNNSPLIPENTRMAGVYKALSVASTPLFDISIIASKNYTFTDVGAVGRGQFVVGTSANVGAISTTPNNRGTYTLSGYRLNISYEDGSKEEHVAVFDIKRPQYLFIDGVQYSSN